MVNLLPPEVRTTQLHPLVQVFKANHQTLYVPTLVYQTRITLLQAIEALPEEDTNEIVHSEIIQDSALGGGEFYSEVDIHLIPGDHMTIMQE